MKKIDFVVPENKQEFSYIGFNFKENKSMFVFPCQYFASFENAGEDLRKREAKKILELIVNFKSEAQSGDNSGAGSLYSCMIWLLSDFLENGYYKEWLFESKTSGSGKIDWKKTLKNNDILFDGENIAYKTVFHKTRKIEENQIITEIYKCCLGWCAENLGWIFDLYDVEKSIFSLKSHENVTFMINFLNAKLVNNFLDYRQKLFSCLMKILKCVKEKDASNFFYANETEFEYIFEKIINNAFGNVDVRKFYTHAYYKIGGKIVNSSKLRPDTIMKAEKEDVFCVIDAKYYNFGYSGNEKDLPASSSITKQIAYAEFIYRKWLDCNSKIKSVFLLPFAAKGHEEKMKFVGSAYYTEENTEDQNVEKRIYVILVDLKTLIDLNYSQNKETKADLQEKLLKILNSN